MGDPAKPNPQSQSPGSSTKPQSAGGRQRVISSCLTCRRRKVRCDHVHPICGACARGNHACNYGTEQTPSHGSGRVSKPTISGNAKVRTSEVQARLDRLESLLEKAVAGKPIQALAPIRRDGEAENQDDSGLTPSSTSQTSQGAGISSDNHDGTLILDDGQSQFVSSLHYALLADEIQDIKALLGDRSDSDEEREMPTRKNLVHLLSLGRAKLSVSLQILLPETQEQRDVLLAIFFQNVDPMVRITHTPTLIRKFPDYIRENQPIAFAVFYSAVNSLPSPLVEQKFGESKEDLLTRFELGLEICLAREHYLTTSSLEVFQGFILWLTCITQEEDMGKAWALLGIAIRIALNQGLHRDPSLFPPGSMDSVTIEVRRRLWHQLCHLEFRAAECRGQEPSISEDDYTTLLPRNIKDEELVDGASPGPSPYDEKAWTSVTFQLVRFIGMRTMRRIVKSTYHLERRILESNLHSTSGPDPARELQSIYEQIKMWLYEMHEETGRRYLQFCDRAIPMQRLCLGLSSLLEWRCYLLFWLRMPRCYRDVVFANEVRNMIFTKSLNLLEVMNGASVDMDAARFQWHIGGHATFQAIMYVLSELRNPLFDSPDRQRALGALQMCRMLRQNTNTKAWSAVKSMIDKAIEENTLSQRSQTDSSAPFSPIRTTDTSGIDPMNSPENINLPGYVAQMPTYAIQHNAESSIVQQPLQSIQPVELGPNPNSFSWDDINFNHIVGDMHQSTEPSGIDFGFWGDPFSFETGPIIFPMEERSYAPFTG
ncbi:fungal-specific transcription factor domain-containing protein [Massariosphaeria phaeospora]|uniref:Fungal-specific transcription factor domain-containing protein n=1 Tax=Massariosphaeria phaeospora TaxID=100035 RepID=A0A7C8M313_9PLEO|nr:fungal-specific transcription factor domain-containing protein [Massariosphaeria phaeospora]